MRRLEVSREEIPCPTDTWCEITELSNLLRYLVLMPVHIDRRKEGHGITPPNQMQGSPVESAARPPLAESGQGDFGWVVLLNRGKGGIFWGDDG